MNVIIPITYPDGFRAGATAMYIVWLFGIFHAATFPLCVAPWEARGAATPRLSVARWTKVRLPVAGSSSARGLRVTVMAASCEGLRFYVSKQ